MKYPKIIFKFSWPLQEYIIKSTYNYKKLESFCNDLESYFKIYEKEIFARISKLGMGWKRKEIKVWIFEGFHSSIPDPLLLNVNGFDKEFCMFKLIELLIYNLLIDNNKRFSKDIEKFCLRNAVEVFSSVFPNSNLKRIRKKDRGEDFRNYIWKNLNNFIDK